MRVYRVKEAWIADYDSRTRLPKGMIVYEYKGCTYGCIRPEGIVVTRIPPNEIAKYEKNPLLLKDNQVLFFEIAPTVVEVIGFVD
jgi:hypothetical protein